MKAAYVALAIYWTLAIAVDVYLFTLEFPEYDATNGVELCPHPISEAVRGGSVRRSLVR